MNGSSLPSHTEHLWILAFATIALAGAFVLQPVDGGTLCLPVPALGGKIPLPPVCFSRLVFGVSCPGCGLTRSFVAFAHGNLREAVGWNPMGPVLFVICLLQVPYRVVEYKELWKDRPVWVRARKLSEAFVWLVPAGLVGCWIFRMLSPNPPVW